MLPVLRDALARLGHSVVMLLAPAGTREALEGADALREDEAERLAAEVERLAGMLTK